MCKGVCEGVCVRVCVGGVHVVNLRIEHFVFS